MKKCCRCKETKKLTEYCVDNSLKSGLCGRCKECMYEYAREYKKRNRKKMAADLREWHKKNPGKHMEYYKNKDRSSKRYKKLHNERNKKYIVKNPHIRRAKWARYHANKLQACPKWTDKNQLDIVYENCPTGYEVDHIIPLRGLNVSGLHVPWNLQYLTRSENASKSNKVI